MFGLRCLDGADSPRTFSRTGQDPPVPLFLIHFLLILNLIVTVPFLIIIFYVII